MLRQHLLHLCQEDSTWLLPVSSRASLFLLLERLFLIFDSSLLSWQLFLVPLAMENRLFPSSLLQPFIHWKTVLSCLPSVFSLEQTTPLCSIFPHKSWFLDLWLFSPHSSELSPIGPCLWRSAVPAGEHNATGEASLALSKVQALLYESCRLYFCLNIAVWHLPFSQLHAIVAERSACDPRPPVLWFLFCAAAILAIVPSLLLV